MRKVPGVKDAEVSVTGFAVIVGPNGKGLNASGNGPPPLAFAWDPSPTLNPVHLVAGKAPVAADDVVIDKHSADTTHYRVGDRIRIVTVSTTGKSAIYRLAGIGRFGTADSPRVTPSRSSVPTSPNGCSPAPARSTRSRSRPTRVSRSRRS